MVAAGDLDTASTVDLHCLHAVFVRLVQEACDRFAGMWNHRKIRGDRTVRGRGGGRPRELFTDPIGSSALLSAQQWDDERWHAEQRNYGEDTPFHDPGEPEDVDMRKPELRTCDPLEGLSTLQTVRSAYYAAHPMGNDDDGERDYVRYKLVCTELLVAFSSFFDQASGFDWAGFAASTPEYKLSCDLFLRWELAKVAIEQDLVVCCTRG